MFRPAGWLARFLRREDGPTATEYAVMLALVAVMVIAGANAVGVNASGSFDAAADAAGPDGGGSGGGGSGGTFTGDKGFTYDPTTGIASSPDTPVTFHFQPGTPVSQVNSETGLNFK